MDVIVTAGGTPVEGDPLFAYTLGRPKALLDISGKPMIQWVLDALNAAQQIRRIVVVGLPPTTSLNSLKPMTLLDDHHGMLENLRAGVSEITRQDPSADLVIAASSDIPALTGEMVDWLINIIQQTEHDLYYNVITREVMEKRFPGSHRTYLHLQELELCGGDINAMRASALSNENPAWNKIIAARKSPLKQASIVGFDTLLMLLLRRYSIARIEKIISQRLGFRGHALLCPYAEMAMDVDKPHQLEIMSNDLTASIAHALANPV
jgi:GTP:adenosylcobinamide-phosphate guanylyltransferase